MTFTDDSQDFWNALGERERKEQVCGVFRIFLDIRLCAYCGCVSVVVVVG